MAAEDSVVRREEIYLRESRQEEPRLLSHQRAPLRAAAPRLIGAAQHMMLQLRVRAPPLLLSLISTSGVC
jgi:hypothetical protein